MKRMEFWAAPQKGIFAEGVRRRERDRRQPVEYIAAVAQIAVGLCGRSASGVLRRSGAVGALGAWVCPAAR